MIAFIKLNCTNIFTFWRFHAIFNHVFSFHVYAVSRLPKLCALNFFNLFIFWHFFASSFSFSFRSFSFVKLWFDFTIAWNGIDSLRFQFRFVIWFLIKFSVNKIVEVCDIIKFERLQNQIEFSNPKNHFD